MRWFESGTVLLVAKDGAYMPTDLEKFFRYDSRLEIDRKIRGGDAVLERE